MPSEQIKRRLTKSILKKTPTLTANICLFLYEIGKITADSFLNQKKFYGRVYDKYEHNSKIYSQRGEIKQGIQRLVDQGLVEKAGEKLSLTNAGKNVIAGILRKKKDLSKKWDGKYRLVIFDIPEKEKGKRHWLREELYLLGYLPLQKSVYIGKHPLAEEIIKDILKLRLKEYVNYLLVDKVFDERRMKFSNIERKFI